MEKKASELENENQNLKKHGAESKIVIKSDPKNKLNTTSQPEAGTGPLH